MSSVRGPCCRERFYFGLATFQVFLFLPNKKGNKTDIENCVGFIKRKPSGLSKVNKKFNIFLHQELNESTTIHIFARKLLAAFNRKKKLLPCLFRLSLYNRAVFRAITRLWIIALK